MKIAFLNCGLQTQLAAQYLVDKHNFTSVSILDTLKQIKNQYFKTIEDENFLYALKFAYESIDKYTLIKYVLNKTSTTNIVIPDISNLIEYYTVLMEGFVPVKIDISEILYDSNLITIPMLKIKSETNIKHFYEAIDTLVYNYEQLEQNKTRGGLIQYIDENQEV